MRNKTTPEVEPALDSSNHPWWREPMCWVVIGGPASVVVASLATAVIAWKHIDPIIKEEKAGTNAVVIEGTPDSPAAPALQGRNHAASPRP